MFKKFSVLCFFLAVLFPLISIGDSKTNYARREVDETPVIKALRTILAAQATYSAVFGNGDYGTNLDLIEAELIDSELGNGKKYGYYFVYSSTPRTAAAPAKFSVTAAPQQYEKTGKTSFYLDQTGFLRGADHAGNPATANDPPIDWCTAAEKEKCVISELRNLHSVQATYQATEGAENYGNFSQLYKAGLIQRDLSVDISNGYKFSLQKNDRSPGAPASFKIFAIPAAYGVTGTKSFYISTDGTVRGADKKGKLADENDPVIDFSKD